MTRHTLLLLLLAPFVIPNATAGPPPHAQTAHRAQPWVASWASSQMLDDAQNNQAKTFADTTIRELVHLSVGGPTLRLHLSNAFGTQPLAIDSVHIARPLSLTASAIDPASDRLVTFAGHTFVLIPAGADYLSDPVDFPAPALSTMAVSLHLPAAPASQTVHQGARATTYLLHGNHTADPILPEAAEKLEHWYNLSAVDVQAPHSVGTIVAFGDSITDGRGTTTNGNDRWTDVLAARLAPRHVAVVNQGIGGNHLLTDGLGLNALSRMDKDVLAQTGIRTIILFEGINDIGSLARGQTASGADHELLIARMEAAITQVVERAHAHGIRVLGATLTPFLGNDYYQPTAANEADRQAVNAWLRSAGHTDGLLDFDQVLRDPANPGHLLPAADSGDHLHPGPAGYKLLGDSIPLNLLH